MHGPRENTDEFEDERDAIDALVQLDWNGSLSGIFAALREMQVGTQYCQTRQWGLLKADLQFCKAESGAGLKKDEP